MVYRVVAGDNLFCLALSSVDNKDDPLSSIQHRRNIIYVLRKYIGIRTRWYSSYFTHICSLGQPVSQFEFWLVSEFVFGGQYSITKKQKVQYDFFLNPFPPLDHCDE